jgi:FkbM family methyltransferase
MPTTRQKIISYIGSYLPENRFKDALRELRYQICIQKRQFVRGTKTRWDSDNLIVRFGQYDGLISGTSIVLPHPKSLTVLSTIIDMPSYFRKEMVHEGDHVIDAGAFPGDWTVLASRLIGPKGYVSAFEPDPDNREYLKEMLEINKATNVEVLPYALAKSSGSATLLQNNHGSALAKYQGRGTPVAVQTISLDDFCSSRPYDAVKMDIEGSELDVVIGGERFLKRDLPNLMIASYHIGDTGLPSWSVLDKVLPLIGYRTETLHPEHPVTYARAV